MASRKYKNKLNNRTYYNYTSEAYKLEPNYDYKYETKPKKKITKPKKVKYILAEKNVKLWSFKLVFFMVTTFIFLGVIVSINALIIQKKIQFNKLTVNLEEIVSNNKYLETELATKIDLDEVERLAVQNLHMNKPLSHQIFYINVPKESYTIKNNSN